MPVWQMTGEVIGTKYRQYPVRTMAQRAFAFMLLTGAAMVRLHRKADFIDHRADFSQRFPARLAGFTGDGFCHVCFSRFKPGSEFLYDRLPFRQRASGPGRKGGARRVTGRRDLCGRCRLALP